MKPKLFTKVAYVPSITHDEWLTYRREGIGGSDAGAIAGLSKYSSAFSVYCDKLNLIPEKEDNEAMRQGRDLEEYVARRFMEAEGKKVQRFGWLIRSDEYPWAIADIDRVIVGENAILECKTTSIMNKTNFEDGDIPPYWYCQCQHYLAVTGCDVCYLAVIILGREYHCFKIERNAADIAALMDLERAFWEDNVIARKEPLPDGTERANKAIGQIYAQSDAGAQHIDFTPYRDAIEQYMALKDQIDELTARKDAIKQELQLYMQQAEKGQCEGYSVSWKTQNSNRLDTELLKAELPDVYKKYLKSSVSRPFKINHKEKVS